MWVAEGLTHRYPTKVLAELLSTCPQYCGHCTRMDLVGNSTPAVDKLKLTLKPVDRYDAHIAYLQAPTPAYATSSSPAATWPTCRGATSSRTSCACWTIETIRDIRLATKALMGLPQHWLQPEVVEGLERVARTAARRGVNLAIHTHVNHVQLADPAGRPGRPDRARGRRARRAQPGRAHARRQRHQPPTCSTCASRCRARPASCPTTSTCAT